MRPCATLGLSLLALSLFGPGRAIAGSPCFDQAVVGQVVRQHYIGTPQPPDGELSMDSEFRWDVRIERVLVGAHAPRQLSLTSFQHAEFKPGYVRHVLLFLARGDDGAPVLVDRYFGAAASSGQALAHAARLGLRRCSGAS